MLSMSAIVLSPRCSEICVTASMDISAKCSLAEPSDLLLIEVNATLRSVLRSLMSKGTAIFPMASIALTDALR